MDDSTPVGFNRRDAVRIDNTVLAHEHSVIDARTPRKQTPRAYDEPQLFIALSDFDKISSDGAEYCAGSADGYVGRAAHLELEESWRENYFYNTKNYRRIDGEAVCMWSPAETACTGDIFRIKCGQVFWAKFNNGRWEAISSGRRQEDGALNACACTRFGFAIWKVGYSGGGSPIWVLDENRCSGCYSATEGRPTIPTDYKFAPTTLNSDWLQTPAAAASAFDPLTTSYTDKFRYVTCCNTPDVYDPPCNLTCCYSVSGIPTPRCDGDTPGTHSRHLGHTAPCAWASDDAGSQIFRLISESNGTCSNQQNFTVGEGLTMTTSTLVLKWVISGTGLLSFGRVVTAVYSLSPVADCVSTLTATLTNIFTTGDSLPNDCKSCNLSDGYFSGLIPSTLTVSPTTCGTTTSTTGSSTTGSTTTGSSTTGSSTTGSTTSSTTSSTTGSTTTSSSTTASSTTNTSTTTGSTTSTSSTTAACTGSCVYTSWAVGSGSPTGWYWLLASSTCSMGCGCPPDDAAEAAAIGRWPVDGSDNATISCA